MEFTDAQLSEQPMGYWSGAAKIALAGYINDCMKKLGVMQPHWWTLYRVGESERGLTRDELMEIMARVRPYVDGSELLPAVDELITDGHLVETDPGRFLLTETGAKLRDDLFALLPRIRERIHDGIPEEDYAVALRVLRRMIENVGGNSDFD